MQLSVRPKSPYQIESSAVLQQTPFWATVKQRQGFITKGFDLSINAEMKFKRPTDKYHNNHLDDLLLILQSVGNKKYIAHIPYGPVMEPEEELQGPLLEELAESLRPFLPKECLLIRFDLRWESLWANDEDRFDNNNKWIGPPDPAIQEMRMNFNTINRNLRKTYSDNLPSNTIFINLNKNTDDLMESMKPKTRYNIRLAQRKGVKVKEADASSLTSWYSLYSETAKRNNVHLHSIEYFRSILGINEKRNSSAAEVHLLMAEADDTPLASMFLVTGGGRATYLYGASSGEKRNLMGAYALQWEAIKKAKAAGCKEYDMFGISQPALPSHPLYGLYRFKTGFGGYVYRRMGCWDYPLNNEEYEVFRPAELNSRGYHVK